MLFGGSAFLHLVQILALTPFIIEQILELVNRIGANI